MKLPAKNVRIMGFRSFRDKSGQNSGSCMLFDIKNNSYLEVRLEANDQLVAQFEKFNGKDADVEIEASKSGNMNFLSAVSIKPAGS